MVEEKEATLEELVEELKEVTDAYAFVDKAKVILPVIVAELGKVSEEGADIVTKVSDDTRTKIDELVERVEEIKGLLRPEREFEPDKAKAVGKAFSDVVKALAEASGILARDEFSLTYSFDPKRGYLLARVTCCQ